MQFKAIALSCSLLLVPASSFRAVAAPMSSPAVSTAPEQFEVKERTTIPNATLKPGSYSIRIVDHLQDRVILEVSGKKGHVDSTFLAVPAATLANEPVGPVLYSAGPKGKAALKGFSFPGGTAVEFVYPKNDAVSIATATGIGVMAIDPASEGKAAAPKLSSNDMQLITLWMLEPARVGPGDAKPTISASRYQAPAPAPAAAPVQTAQAAPEPPPAPAPVAPPAPAVASNTAPADAAVPPAPAPATPPAPRKTAPVQMAANDVPPAPAVHHTRPAHVKALPHTASNLPWLEAAAAFFLMLGSGLSLRRFREQR